MLSKNINKFRYIYQFVPHNAQISIHSGIRHKKLKFDYYALLLNFLWKIVPVLGIWAFGLFLPTIAEAQWSAAFRISNQVLVSPNIYEYEVYLQNTSAQSFRLHSYQFGVGVDTAVLNGGSLQVQYVDSSCQLTNLLQAPFWQFDSSTATVYTNINVGNAVHVLAGKSYRFINNTAVLPPLFVQASVVPVSAAGCPQPGVRIGRFRAVNSVAFGRGSRPFHMFASVNAAGMTQSVVSLFVTPTTQQFLYPNASNNALTLVNWNSAGGVCDVNPMFNCRDSVSVVASVCSPNSFLMGGVSYSSSGNYQATLVNSLGCDSLVSLNLVVITPPNPGVISGSDSLCVGGGATYTVGVAGGVWSSSDSLLLRIHPVSGQSVAVAPGTAVVSYTLGGSGGCGPVGSVKPVVVAAPLSVGPISGSDSLCVGAVVNYSTTTAGGVWSSSDTSILRVHPVGGQAEAIANGSVFLNYTLGGAGACLPGIGSKRIVVLPLPLAPVLTRSVNSDTLFANTSLGNRWYRNGVLLPAFNDRGFIPIPGNGGYRCIRRDLYGCESDSSNLQLISTSGASEMYLYPLQVFPNPNYGAFSIDFDCAHLQISEIRISDALGRQVNFVVTEPLAPSCLRECVMAGRGSGLYYLTIIFSSGDCQVFPLMLR